ncbi:MAG: S-layer homology domain-containing protein [Clostridia bacterium]|nr:S-layer homology domain-containing protein [Clostridia bacterium]
MRQFFRRAFVALLCVLMLAICVLPSSAVTFSDVKEDWYTVYVNYMAEKGIVGGYPDGTFRPQKDVTRAEFIKMMVVAFGLEAETYISFSDVPSNEWYYSYYRKAAQEGFLTEVFTTQQMKPTQKLTREETAALLMAYLDYPTDAKASSSSFTDYYSVAPAYRDYVLQAVQAGIIDGYPDGTFRPTKTLLRTEVSKMLAKAVGTIANRDTSSLEFSESKNLIVTEACTVSGLTIDGNVIISSGVSGTVTFVGCDINGFVSNRSTAKVVFSGCEVAELNLDTPRTSVELKQNTAVSELNVLMPSATVTFATGAAVNDMTVASGSSSVTVNGTGTITKLSVNATGFTSSFVPLSVNIASGIPATIANVVYKNGMKGNPTLGYTSDAEIISIETYLSGTVKYYFTSSGSAVTSAAFNTAYAAATSKNDFNIVANTPVKQAIIGPDVDANGYIVIALVSGNEISTPTVINRKTAKYGYTATPTLVASGTNDALNFAPASVGTLYYYYTNNPTAPVNYAAGKAEYDLTDSSVKGTLAFTAAGQSIRVTKASNAVSGYSHLVGFFITTDFQCYPFVVERPVTAVNVTEDPYALKGATAEDKDVLVINPAYGTTVRYFYSNSAANDFINNFDTYYSTYSKETDEAKRICGVSGYLTANKENKVELLKPSGTYDYVIIKVGSSKAEALKIRKSGTGFKTEPYVTRNTIVDNVSFESDYQDGTVYYVYVSTASKLNAEAFWNIYNNDSNKYKGELGNSVGAAGANIPTGVGVQANNITQRYVAFMFKNSYGDHKPVVVERKAVGNGFDGTPVAEYRVDEKRTVITFGAMSQYTEIEYFFTNENLGTEVINMEFRYPGSSNKEVYPVVTGGSVSGRYPTIAAKISGGPLTVGENIIATEADGGYNSGYVNTDIYTSFKYVALRVKSSNGLDYSPVLVNLAVNDDGVKLNGENPDIKISKDVDLDQFTVKIDENPNLLNGSLQYVYSKTKPTTKAEYDVLFNSNSNFSDRISISSTQTSLTFPTVLSYRVADYGYFVYRITDKNGKVMTPGCFEIPMSQRTRITDVQQNTPGSGYTTIKFLADETLIFNAKWLYSTVQLKDLTSSEFNTRYNSYGNSSIRGHLDDIVVSPNGQALATTKPTETGTVKYKYLYIMLVDKATGNCYKPVEIVLPE